jgi:glucose/arabinose dehydrogenase
VLDSPLGAPFTRSAFRPGSPSRRWALSGEWNESRARYLPDGRIFAIEKRGRVYVIENNRKLPQPFLDIEGEVLNHGDRGLLGIALDPNFLVNGHVYLLYTVDPDGDGIDDGGSAFSRLTRYTASSGNRNVADPASRLVLIGSTWETGIPSVSSTHTIGALRFSPDGSLLVSSGESAHADSPDAGGKDPSAFRPGRTLPAEDIGAFRAQWTGSPEENTASGSRDRRRARPNLLLGDPSTTLPGLRAWPQEPFRFCIRPGSSSPDPAAGQPGTLYISDVGWKRWEEVDVSARGGENFGWPCREGLEGPDGYPAAIPAHHGCATIGTPENPGSPTSPLLTWHHTNSSLSSPPPLVGKCVTGIAFYTGQTYPAAYRGLCFVAEYDKHWIRAVRVDSGNRLIEVLDFATDAAGPVDLVADPVSGDLFYVSILDNEIRRIRYDPSNSAPVAQATGVPVSGEAPLTVRFSSTGTRDPDEDILTYSWSFGDGGSSTEPDPIHTYERGGSYAAILTVEDGRGGQASATVNVAVSGARARTGLRASIPFRRRTASSLVDSLVELRGAAVDEDAVESLEFTLGDRPPPQHARASGLAQPVGTDSPFVPGSTTMGRELARGGPQG